MKYKLTAFLSAAALLLSLPGCIPVKESSSKDIPVTPISSDVGKYVEEEVIIPVEIMENSMTELFLCDNSPAFIEIGHNYLYQENESQTAFTASSLSFPEGDISIHAEAGFTKETSYLVYINYENYDSAQNGEAYEELCGYRTPEGTWKSFSLGDSNVMEMECSPDGRLFATGYDLESNALVYEINTHDETITPISTLENSSIISLDIVGDYVIFVSTSFDGDSISFYNYKTNQLEETPKVIEQFVQEQKFAGKSNRGTSSFDICAGEEGTMYIACESGLYRYVLNGNQVEQLIDGVTCHLGNPAWKVDSILQENSNTFFIAYTNGRIMRYYYDKNAGNSYDSELNVFSLTADETVMNTIAEYNLQYPNVKVNYTTVRKNDTDYESAVEQLETILSSDNPPDVIVTDDLELSHMIQAGYFMDLSEQEKLILPESGVLENIAKPKQNGKWYTIPCRFKLPYIAGNKKELDSISNISDFLQLCQEKSHKRFFDVIGEHEYFNFFFDYTPEGLLQTLLPLTWNLFVTENAIDIEAAKQFLTDCREYYEIVIQNPGTYSTKAHGHCYFSLSDNDLVAGTVCSLNDLLCLNTLSKVDPSRIYSMDKMNQNCYIPSCSLSISANAPNEENAIRFLNTAVSDDVQSIKSEDGLPVNISVIERFSERRYGSYSTTNNHFYSETTKRWTLIQKLSEAEYKDFYEMITKLNTPLLDNGAIKEAFLTYGADYIVNKIVTAESAVASIAKSTEK